MKYFDKNNERIVEGDYLIHDSNDIDRVVLGDKGLGFDATDPIIRKKNGMDKSKVNPLSNFDMKEWVKMEMRG